jgi:hypothetical protein
MERQSKRNEDMHARKNRCNRLREVGGHCACEARVVRLFYGIRTVLGILSSFVTANQRPLNFENGAGENRARYR